MLIAHISDLHVRPHGSVAYGRVHTNFMLEAAVARIKAIEPRPDCVLVSGDIADCGREEEYGIFADILAPLSMPVFVIPGNHDRREVMLRALGKRHSYLPRTGGFVDYVIDEFPVRLIGLDTVIDGATHGEFPTERVAWLERRLAEGKGRPTVIFMHHTPFPIGVGSMDEISCRDGAALGPLIRRHPEIERVLCGHHHRPIHLRWAGTIGFVAPSTAHQVALDLRPGAVTRFILEPPGFAVHAWHEGAGMTTHVQSIGDFGAPFDVVDDPDYPGKAGAKE